MRKLFICTPIGTFSAFHYIVYTFLRAITPELIKFKFSAFLSLVEATKCVKFQSDRCKVFKVDIFRISPITVMFRSSWTDGSR